MANNYFDNNWGVGSEQDLATDLVEESIEISGRDYLYIPRDAQAIDMLLNDAPLSSFEEYKKVTLWLQNYTDLDGQNTLLSKFGLNLMNTASFVVGKRHSRNRLGTKPMEGALIYDTLSKLIFEISKVEDEPQGMTYQLQKNYIYVLQCKLFTYSHEDFNTDINELDNALDPTTFESPFDQSDAIQTEATDAQNWDEQNPFGTIPKDE